MYATLELFHYNPTYLVWICKTCQQAVTPNRLVSHLARKHIHHPSVRTSAQRVAIYDEVLKVRHETQTKSYYRSHSQTLARSTGYHSTPLHLANQQGLDTVEKEHVGLW